ncbi:LysE family translocator (plasmid) [Rhizobium sp. CB3090]|uniref:LysE family translocator n=1 Tax=Rhizobium sp. CB3090 TaxID=3039156 RepID=UPI0024B1D23D|nr:LysE family translocator [Rhizobium sp. CB3090]WFU13229.1 LysE family translocator [Rhizobium sp. CB3090]
MHSVMIAYMAYVLGASSPGPSNLAIMNTAMRGGRAAALALAAGVVSISWTWAVLASTGLAALLLAYPQALTIIQFIGGCYLLYLAAGAARSAVTGKDLGSPTETPSSRADLGKLYRRGVLIHVANPKAIMAWVATISLGLQPGAPSYMPFVILFGCAVLSVAIFGGYAIVFSYPPISRFYTGAQRWIDGVLALFFASAGLALLRGAVIEAAGYMTTGG